jgi:hypothetical protein
LKLYSAGMAELMQAEGVPVGGSPWQSLAFELPGLANGLYFYRLDVEDARAQRARSSPGKLYVLR